MNSFTKWSRGLAVSFSGQSEQLNWNVMPSWTFPALISGGDFYLSEGRACLEMKLESPYSSIWPKKSLPRKLFQNELETQNSPIWSGGSLEKTDLRYVPPEAEVWLKSRPTFDIFQSRFRAQACFYHQFCWRSVIFNRNISSLRWLWVQRSRSSQRRTLMSFSSRCSLSDILWGYSWWIHHCFYFRCQSCTNSIITSMSHWSARWDS